MNHNPATILKVKGRLGTTVHLQAVVDEGILFVILDDVDPENPGVPKIGAPVLSWAGEHVAHHRVYAGEEGCVGFEPWEGRWPCPWSKEAELSVCLWAGKLLGVVTFIPLGIGGEA